MGSVEDRERLKEEYKEHFRAIKEVRKKAAESERMAKIARALEDMNADHLLDSADEVLHRLREKIEIAEAKLDMIIQHRDNTVSSAAVQEFEDAQQKQKAAQTLQKIRAEMGLLQDEMDDVVSRLSVSGKSLGPADASGGHSQQAPTGLVHKTLGPKKTDQ
jgi:phage shock protein A